MKLQIFAVLDLKAQAYMQPFFQHNKATAERTIANCKADPKHPLGQNPDDYMLFHLGVYDDASASFELLEFPDKVGP